MDKSSKFSLKALVFGAVGMAALKLGNSDDVIILCLVAMCLGFMLGNIILASRELIRKD